MSEKNNNRIGGFFEGKGDDQPEDSGSGSNETPDFEASFEAIELNSEDGDIPPHFLEDVGAAFGIDPMEILKQGANDAIGTPFGVVKLSLDAQGNLQLTQPSGAPATPELIEAFCRMVEVLQHLPQMKQLFKAIPGLKGFVDHMVSAVEKQKNKAKAKEQLLPKQAPTPRQVQALAGRVEPFGQTFSHLSRASYEN